ncbi:hypothetical protein JYU34_004673 [Plutella xylostella]|uniref:Uncharacterized protein n=1 Tax=Plutella xylostella TaxID=51655 RepID=A0ABQ7PRK5_PLUXY|nr:hypothetical protein JYU34_022509 [Plutella xylostella]KAG7301226.1 hypothetical protein JYU34_014117 [Plutella xylostella]KAG7302178.1 hypothetical protein JYU34_013650 [Plutella xylostella]KAG7310131.1 hypothetical protein JYU34_004673 [Plutella xylostella]
MQILPWKNFSSIWSGEPLRWKALSPVKMLSIQAWTTGHPQLSPDPWLQHTS